MSGVTRRLGALGALYLAQGLPYGFFTQALPVMMRERGLSLEAVGASALLALPWALKFAWSPLVDRYGTRRAWIVPIQIASALLLLGLALLDPSDLRPLYVAVVLVNLLAATQDIATDGLAVDLLRPEERGLGNGVQVAGYRVGMIVGGGALLVVYGAAGWAPTFVGMALLVAAATGAVLFLEEPARARAVGSARVGLRLDPFLLVAFTYKFGEAFAQAMLRPYLVDIGYGMADVGWMLGTVGFVAGLVGALVGGVLSGRLGRRRALLGAGLLQAAAVAGYALTAASGRGLLAAIAVEHLASGAATVALFTMMMDRARPEAAATDYTILASAVVISTGTAAALSGVSAGAVGYVAHFGMGAALCVLTTAFAAAFTARRAPVPDAAT